MATTFTAPDYAITVGFNGELELSRSRIIMEGAACCDFPIFARSLDGPDQLNEL
ncbi:MAG: hypothetical protein JO283_11650 [Bradyrhizobium sp.]|nr:hypothetical protein [Bradyrhizobium sp.]